MCNKMCNESVSKSVVKSIVKSVVNTEGPVGIPMGQFWSTHHGGYWPMVGVGVGMDSDTHGYTHAGS